MTQTSSIEKLLYKYRAKKPTTQSKGEPIPKSRQSSVAPKLMGKPYWQYPGWQSQSELLLLDRKAGTKGWDEKQQHKVEITSLTILKLFCPRIREFAIDYQIGLDFEEKVQDLQPQIFRTEDGTWESGEPKDSLKNAKVARQPRYLLKTDPSVELQFHTFKRADIEKKLDMAQPTVHDVVKRMKELLLLVEDEKKRLYLHPTIRDNLLFDEERRKMSKSDSPTRP